MDVISNRTRLWLNRDVVLDWLIAIEYGRVDDGQPQERWHVISDEAAYLHAGPADRSPAVGFRINRFSEINPADPELEALWNEPLFDCPQLGLTQASAGEIAVSAQGDYLNRPTLNRIYFWDATELEGAEAVGPWTACLETGDLMASFALGYTLYKLGDFHRSYRRLRYYAEIAPAMPWTHVWYGRAAEAIGETAEAVGAYERAIELTSEGAVETDAPELLDALRERLN